MRTITDIKFNENLYSHLNQLILILYQMEEPSLSLTLSNAHLMTFIQPFDNISRCQDHITINDRKTFTLFTYSGNIRTWLSKNNRIPNNVDRIIIFCPFASEVEHWKRWTRRYIQKIKAVITYDALERELLMFGIKYIEGLFLHFQDDKGILNLLNEDRRKMCSALADCFEREAKEQDEFIRSDVTETS